jgi:uncharacterized 2Fe-2S/4Fe-4S cluster protein (DUF4445 family)
MNLDIESSKGRQTLPVALAEQSLRVSELLRRKHLPLNTRCGQRGLCDGCVVELVSGQLVHHMSGKTVSGPASVRGCECRLAEGDVSLRIPHRSLLAYEPQVVSEFKTRVPRAHDPLWQQVEIPVSELSDICAAVARRTKRRRAIRLENDVQLDHSHRNATAYATIEYREDHWLITGVSDAPVASPLGVAVDIGTTTVALLLTDLTDGRVAGSAANFNKQIHLGDDVLTRINLCSTHPEMLGKLRELVVKETIAPLLEEALRAAKADARQVQCMTVAANTTMLHIFAGIDPSSMGIAPFTAEFLNHRVLTGADSPFPFIVHLLPSASAYVGADLTAGAFATGLVYDDGPNLLVDVGTNGEIVLKRGEHLFGCATAAGPAFEGAGLTNGVRATEGAISHVELTAKPFTVKNELIGEHLPIGLCGTAYIDFLAEGRALGVVNEHGRFEDVDGADSRIIPWRDYGRAFRIAQGPGKTDIVITEVDIANLLQAKAAIAAGILTLLERIGLTAAQIKRVYLAGGFGLHLSREHAIGCGLLPGFAADQIEVVGNTSLAGAYLSLLDCGALDEVARAAGKMEVIELNLDPGFEDRYIEQLALPADVKLTR